MAQIRRVDVSAKYRLTKRTKGYDERQPYREAVASMNGTGMIEVEPEAGETLRKIKLNLARASKEVGRPINYGETADSTVLAWLSDSDAAPRKRRARRPKVTAEAE